MATDEATVVDAQQWYEAASYYRTTPIPQNTAPPAGPLCRPVMESAAGPSGAGRRRRTALQVAGKVPGRLVERLVHVEDVIHYHLVAHSVTVLRVALGAIFLGFGVLKFFPGVSPAENLVKATAHVLDFGLVPGAVSIVVVATIECFIGVSLLANRGMRVAIWALAVLLVGILAPLVLLPGRLFSGPYNAPTLEGQYVLKDLILVAAGMVVAAATFRGGRLVRADLPPAAAVRAGEPLDGEQKLRVVLEGAADPATIAEISERDAIPEADIYDWRDTARVGAERALAAPPRRGDR